MSSITIHSLDKQVDRLIRELATEKNQSLNKTVKWLLRDALSLPVKKKTKKEFADLSGVWTKEEYEEFEQAVKDLEKIDREKWQ